MFFVRYQAKSDPILISIRRHSVPATGYLAEYLLVSIKGRISDASLHFKLDISGLQILILIYSVACAKLMGTSHVE